MLDWLLDKIPLWIWIALAVAGLFAAWRFLGLKGMLAAAAAVGGALLYRQGRKTGSSDALAKQKRADEKAVKDHDRIKSETDRMSDAQLDDANSRWVRKRKL